MKDKFYRIVKENVSELFESEKLSDESMFIDDLGFDSVSLMQLIIEVEEQFSIEFDDINYGEVDSVGKMYEYIMKKIDEHEEI